MATSPVNSKQGSTGPRQVEALVVYLHGLAVHGADEALLYARACAWRDLQAPGLRDAELRTIVASVLEKISRQPPNPSTPPDATDAKSPPCQGGNTGFSDSQDTQEPQGATKSSPAEYAGERVDATLDEKKITPEEEGRATAPVDRSLSLAEYLFQAAWHIARNELGGYEAGSETGGWLSPLWTFTRLCKGHPDLAKLSVEKAFDKVTRTWRSLRQRQAPYDPAPNTGVWSRWANVDDAEAEVDFFGCWERVRFLPGCTPLESAAEQARLRPLKLLAREDRPSSYAAFVSLVGWLQVTRGDVPIYLPVRDVAKFLKCSTTAVSRYLRWAIQDNLLTRIAEHTYHPKSGHNKAAEYRFAVDRFPCLKEKLPDQ